MAGDVGREPGDDVWRGARMRSFVNSGGVAAQLASPTAGAVFEEPAPGAAAPSWKVDQLGAGRGRDDEMHVGGLRTFVRQERSQRPGT